MSISNRGSHTPVGDDAPLGDNTSAGEQFNRFEVGIGTPADDVGNPGFEIGISAPPTDVGSPGLEIGISAPPTDDVVPAGNMPAGDGTSSGDAGDSSEGVLTWDSLSEITPVTIADDNDELTGQKGGGAAGDPTAASPAGGNTGTLLTLGTNPDGSHFFTGNRNVDAVLIGSMWSTPNLTYSFPTTGTNYNGTGLDSNGVNNYHLDLGTQQQAAARASFAQLMAATGLTFTEITETDGVHANIRISQSADADVGSAYGGFPSDTRGVAGDIWFGRTNQPYYDMAFKGTWGFATMMHEIGHTMGLKHGHQDYTNSDLSFYFGTTPRFGSQSLTPDRDGQSWSLMTYTPAPFTNSNFAGEKINQPQTYMQYDLAALQYLYGANFNTNNGDSVYTFSQTTGEMFINGVGQGAPAGNKIYLTIWDGGGNDTINASNYANGVTIDLRPGEFSTVDQAQLANNLAYQNLVNLAPGNFAMSLLYNNDARSLIENATGGTGNDIFLGNTANNVLDGGAGSDTVIFTNVTGVNVTLNDTNTDVIVTHDGETDTLRSIENIQGTSANDILIGNSQNNTLSGGSGGMDSLTGGGGDDRLIGSGFTIAVIYDLSSVTSQPDITKAQATNNNNIANAVNTAGFFDIDANANIANATTIPHATINATATGGAVEYYRIDVTAAGAQAIFDIDGGGTLDDSILELVDSAGNLLASNDTGTGDATFPGHDDAYLTYTFAAAGTYYIRVGRFISNSVAQPMLVGQTYQLNISLQGAAGTTTFTPSTGSVVADGGAGNDVIVGTLASDTLIGGADNDTASFVNAYNNGSTTGVTVDLNLQGAAQNTVAAGNDTLTGFENLIGSSLNDTLTGDGNANIIEGGLGNDTLIGGAGSDTASYASATTGVTANLALQGSAQNTVGAGTDTLSGFQDLLGSSFNDTLTGDAAENVITGGAGNDTLDPGANTGGTVDLLDGGIGTDTASFTAYASAVTATLNGASDGSASIAGGVIAILRSIENLVGSANADILTGDAADNAIEGGLGNDTLNGGLGNDTLVFSGSTAAVVNLATVTAQTTGFGSDTILNFENVRTGSGGDTVTGDGNDNIFFDGGGADTYNGAAGLDTVDYTNIAGALSVNLTLATAQAASTGGDILSGIENVTGSLTGANTILGSAAVANRLVGGAGIDYLEGNTGNDTLIGGAGNDILNGDLYNSLATGADVLEGGAGSDILVGGAGNDTLRGGDGDDQLIGGIANGNAASVSTVFSNDGGQDTFDGGDGTDIAYAYYTDQLGAVVFDLRNLAGNSAITVGGVAAGSFTSIERVIFRGGTVADDVHGTGYIDTLVGNAGNDILDGWYGNDTLSGGLGDDTLIGGEGLDTATYVNATAGVTVDLRILGAQNTGGEGVDTLSGIEYLTGSGFGDTLRGDDDFNLIIDNTVTPVSGTQTDSLYGYGGNDSLLVTRASGIVTTILMDGGDGDDLIQLAAGTVTFTTDPATGASSDLLGLSSGAFYAAPGRAGTRFLDNVTVFGGNGNDRVVLTGVDAATVDLGSGNDILSIVTLGTAGFNDYDITTGTGQDTIYFAGSSATQATVIARNNVVHDFTVGDLGDRFELRTAGTTAINYATLSWVNTTNFTNLVNNTADMFDSGHFRLLQSGSDLLFQVDRDGSASGTNGFFTIAILQGAYTGALTAFNFDGMIGSLNLTGIGALNETLTGASKADVLNGGDGNDSLLGLAGNDTLNGGNADDTLTGGAGNDNLNGGTGYDSAVFSGNRADYLITLVSPGLIQVQDTRSGTPDGTDQLTGIERLVFADEADNIPVVTGPVLVSVAEDSGLHFINPLANATDPDGHALVAIPVGPLPAGVSFVGASAATINFSDYALGSVVGQFGWTDATPTSPDNLIVDVSGNRMLRLANDPTSGDFGGPFSPAFTLAAGEGAAAADTLTFSFVIKAVNNVADGSRLEIDLGSSDRDDRYNFMAVEYTAGGLRLLQNSPTTTLDVWQSNNFDWGGNVQLALLNASVSHTIQVVFRAVDGSNNDIVEYYVDGVLVGTGSSFENFGEFHAGQPHASAINNVNNVLFRAGDPAGNPFPADGPGGNRQGFYVDDLAMSAYDSHQLQFNANDPAYQHLAAGATQLVTVNYNVADGHGGLTAASTVITVTGVNDAAIITGVATGAVVESGVGPGNTPFPGTPNTGGTLNASDVDDGEAEFDPIAAGVRTYGTFTVAANGAWTYTLNNADGDTNALYVGQVVTDTITVFSEDHSASQVLTVTITGTNDLPVITGGPVTGTATEGGGVYFFNPLAHASDPDAGDGLAVIPIGPLPAGVSFVGGSAATISFSDYALGTVVGQHGWTDASPGSPDNEIVDVSGNRMLRLANDPTSGDFGGPYSPAFAISAGEGAVAADTLSFSFVVRAVSNVADGSRLEIDLGSSTRDDRFNFMALEYVAGGLRLVQNSPLPGGANWTNDNFDWAVGNVQLGALLNASVSHTIQVVFRAVDGSNNDIVEYYVDGVLVGTGSTFENLSGAHSVNNVLFRAGEPAGNPTPADGPGGQRQGFYIDDLAMSAYDSHQLQFNANDPAYDHLVAGATQLVTVNYNVADGHGGVTPTSTVITVTGTNDGAAITGVATGAVVESGVGPGNTPNPGTPSATGMLTVNDVDDGENELVPIVAGTAGANGYGTFAVAANGSWTYTLDNSNPAVNALALGGSTLSDSILVYSEDLTASQVITVTISGTNDAPVAGDDIASATEDGAVVFGSVAGNDSDVDTGATRTWALVGTVPGLTLNADGSYVFNPLATAYQHIAAGATQIVVATYAVTDEHSATDIGTLTITVTGANDAPDAANDVNSASEDGALLTGNVGSNDTDVDDGATRTFALVGSAPAGLTFNADGSYSFNPGDAAYQHLSSGTTATVAVSYTISDGTATDTATLTITVNGTNDAPIAGDDIASATEDGSIVTGTVATNDTDIDDDGATRSFALNGTVAGLAIASDGSYSFDPSNAAYQHIAAGATQVVVATYTVTDAHGGTDTATLTITVTGTNDGPVAVNDTNSATEDGSVVTGNVGSNDTDVDDDGATRTFALDAAPPAGLTFNPNGSYSFNPADVAYQHIALGATQIVSAAYTVTDSHGATSTATLTITVTGTNDAPVGNDDVASATEGAALVTGSVATNDTDVDDGATRTFALVGGAPPGLIFNPNGSYSFNPSNVAYQHIAAGATQVVVATYVVTDGQGATDTATLTITVTGTNDGPSAADDSKSATEDGAIVTGSVGDNDTDLDDDGATRTFTLNAAPPAGLTFDADGSYSFNPANAAYQHIALGATQIVSAAYTVTDSHGASTTATLTITVNGTNDAPDAVNDTIVATEDGVPVSGSLATNDTDADDGATRTYLLLAPVAGLSLSTSGTYNFDPASYDSVAAGSSLSVTASYRVIDNNGASDTASITITINGVNDAPDAINDTNTATEDGLIVNGNVSFNDVDVDSGDSRTYALNAPVAGLALAADGSYTFNPGDAAYQHIAAGATQIVVATYTMTDGSLASDTATLTITVTGANDAPDAVDDTRAVNEDGGTITGNVGGNDTDADDGATRTFASVGTVPAGLIFNPDGSYSFDPSNAAYQHLAAGITEVVTLTYTISDGTASDTATLTITVTGANDAPDAVDDTDTATEDGALVTGTVATNDSDGDDGAGRTYALVGAAPAGLTFDADGNYSFNPSSYDSIAEGATQNVVVTYVVTDNNGASDTATLTITVAGVNDEPDAVNDTAAATEDGAVVTGNVGTNDTDVDTGDTRTYALVGAAPAGLTFGADGGYSFNPLDPAYQHIAAGATQTVVVTYTLADNHGGSDTATLTLTVTGANDAPVAASDTNAATEDGAIVTGNVGTNDSDADDGATRTYALVGAAPAGLTFNPDGSYSFDPASYDSLAAGVTQTLAVTYVVTDNAGATASSTLTITVNGLDDAGVAGNDSATISEAATIVGGNLFANDSDADDALTVGAVNGSAANVGVQITLASGAHLTVRANGTYDYDPNGAFNSTPAPGSGASNTPAHDSFTYTLAGGGTATVTLNITGLDTNDLLLGTAGADVLAGGGGDDTYVVDGLDTVTEAAGQGFDVVYASQNFALSAGSEVEVISVTDVNATIAFNLTGNELGQALFGNAGDNFLIAGGGADALYGGLGNDTYSVDTLDVVFDTGGSDIIYSSTNFELNAGAEIEILSANDFALTTPLNLAGNERDQQIFGNAGDNFLIAGFGADGLYGGRGNDTYSIDSLDVVVENAGEGYDTIYTSTGFILTTGNEVEVISVNDFAATTGINLTGNEFGQQIFGNAGANVLNGGAGTDSMAGNAGADTFAFTTALGATNVDTILDFVSGSDKVALDHGIFTGLGVGTLSAGAFVIGTAAGDADDRIIYNSTTGQLFYDADGNGGGAAVLFATLSGHPAIVASDFIIT